MLNFKNTITSLLLLCNILFAQKHNFIHYGVEEGLSESHVYSICEDSLGYLYIGTDGGGLAQFDGKDFKNFTFKDGINGNTVFSVFYQSNGNLWAATNRGITVLENGIPKSYSIEDGLLSNNIWSVYAVDSTAWIGTELGLNILKKGKLTSCTNPLFKSNEVLAITVVDTNNIWFGTKDGLIHYNGTEYIKKNFPSVGLVETTIYSVEFDNYNNLWIASINGLFKLSNNSIKKIDNLSNKICQAIFIDSKENIWVGTENGLNKISDDKIEIFNVENGLSNNCIWTIYEDRNQNLWIGTELGINKLNDDVFRLYDNGIYKKTWSINQFSDNTIYFGFDNAGAAKYINGKLEPLPYNKDFYKKSVWCIYEDSKSNIWFGSDQGAYIYSNNQLKYFDKLQLPQNESIMSMIEDSYGNYWFATFWDGLYRYDGENVQHFTIDEGLCNNSVYNVYEDKNNIVWIGTDYGLNYYQNDSLYKYKGNKFLQEAAIMSITSLNNDLWIGTYGTGVCRLSSNNELELFNESSGLNDNTVLFLSIDKNDNIWVGTNRGLNKIHKFNNEYRILSWSSKDGFPGIETAQNSSLVDNENILWYGTVDGIVKADLNKLDDVLVVNSNLILKDIKIFYKSILENKKDIIHPEIKENLELAHDQNSLVFEYVDINLTNPDKVRYKTILKGFDKHWSLPSNNQRTIYSNLPPGTYKFIIESSSDNFRTINRVEQKITIQTPFWKTWWFYITVFLVVIIIVYLIYRSRVKTLYAYNLKLRENIGKQKEYEKKLIQSEKGYREIFEHAHNPILIIDPSKQNIVDANLAALKLYKYTKSQFEGMQFADFVIDIKRSTECLATLMESGTVKQFFSDHKDKNGKVINLEINATILNYKDQQMIMAILRDLTEREETLKNLEKAKIAAEKSDKMKSEFLAQMSHEIRTPINTIMNYSALLKMDMEETKAETETTQECFLAIDRGANRLIRTIDLVLNMSDLESGTYEATYEETNLLDEILIPIKEEFLSNAKQKKLDLIIKNELSDKCNLIIDRYTTTQIFVNLIDNAIKYTHKGKVEAIVYKKDNNIIVDIADTGIGISEEYIPSLFAKFSQEEQGYTRKFEGNGLGLALVKEYCNINSAEISVTSKKGEGTIFKVSFKIEKSSTS